MADASARGRRSARNHISGLKRDFLKKVTQRTVPSRNGTQDQFREIRNATYRMELYRNATGKIETSSICVRRAATTPADFALRNFHSMFFDKRKITCGTLRCVTCGAVCCGFFPQHFLEMEFCLRMEFSRKDFVKREKRCVTLPSCGNPA